MSLISDPHFASGAPGWRPVNYAGDVVFGQQNDAATARTKTWFAYARTAVAGGSVALDVTYFPDVFISQTVLAWVRARTGVFSGTLAYWDLTPNTNESVNFTVGETWTPITVMGRASGAKGTRIEFYMDTLNADLLIDSVNLF
jgi:hypothetical protein